MAERFLMAFFGSALLVQHLGAGPIILAGAEKCCAELSGSFCQNALCSSSGSFRQNAWRHFSPRPSSPATAGDPVIAAVGDYWMPRMRGA
jgi:hypothetical protein